MGPFKGTDKISKYIQVSSEIKHLSNVLGHLKRQRKACKKQFVSGMNKSQNILEQNLPVLLANVSRRALLLQQQHSSALPALWAVGAVLGTGGVLWD